MTESEKFELDSPQTPVESNSPRWGTTALIVVVLIPLTMLMLAALLIYLFRR